MGTKLSFVANDLFYTKSDLQIPENESTNKYTFSTIGKIKEVLKKENKNLQMVLFEFADNTCYYWYDLNGKVNSYWTSMQQLDAVNITPNFIAMHESNEKSESQYKEIDLLLQHPEIYEFLPIKTEENVKQFLDFVINVLNINFHPDDSFDDYLNTDESIIDSKGNKIIFDSSSVKFMESLIQVCFLIAGDQIYEWGLKILIPEGIPEQNQDQQIQKNITQSKIHFQEIEQLLINEKDLNLKENQAEEITSLFLNLEQYDDFLNVETIEEFDEFIENNMSNFDTQYIDAIYFLFRKYYPNIFYKNNQLDFGPSEGLAQIIEMFNQINKDNLSQGNTLQSLPLIKENKEYYIDQLENLETDSEMIDIFSDWIEGREFDEYFDNLLSEFKLPKNIEKDPHTLPLQLIMNMIQEGYDSIVNFWAELEADNSAILDVLEQNYPYHKSFDELEIKKWTFIVLNGKDIEKYIHPKPKNIFEALKLWYDGLEELDVYVSAYLDEFPELNNTIFNKDLYPFDNILPVITDETEHWLETIASFDITSGENRILDNLSESENWKPFQDLIGKSIDMTGHSVVDTESYDINAVIISIELVDLEEDPEDNYTQYEVTLKQSDATETCFIITYEELDFFRDNGELDFVDSTYQNELNIKFDSDLSQSALETMPDRMMKLSGVLMKEAKAQGIKYMKGKFFNAEGQEVSQISFGDNKITFKPK